MSLSAFQKQKIEDYFRCLDVNRSGALDEDDFLRAVGALKQALGLAEDDPGYQRLRAARLGYWRNLLSLVDVDDNGEISLEEFFTFHERLAAEVIGAGGVLPDWARENARALHEAIDLNGDGAVTGDEFALYLSSIGSDADPDIAFSRLDRYGDGWVSVDDLDAMVLAWLMTDDETAPGNWVRTGRAPL